MTVRIVTDSTADIPQDQAKAAGITIVPLTVFFGDDAYLDGIELDNAGFYSAPNLLPGNYEITMTASGFSTQVRSGVTLTVGARQVLDITMSVGTIEQKVLVVEEAPLVQLASSAISNEVNATTVRELPLNGRSWTDLTNLQPGSLYYYSVELAGSRTPPKRFKNTVGIACAMPTNPRVAGECVLS